MPAGLFGEINIKSIGAKGDGVTDDTAIINSAISDLVQGNGGIIYFPPGIYPISSSLVVTNVNNITFRGSGATCTQIVRVSGFVAATFASLAGVVRCTGISLPDTGFSINGNCTAPGVPASTTPLTNPFPFRVQVFIINGTVTVIAVGGVTTGLQNTSTTYNTVTLNPGETVTLTYSVAPTWTWFGIDG